MQKKCKKILVLQTKAVILQPISRQKSGKGSKKEFFETLKQ